MTKQALDESKVQAFAGRIIDFYVGGLIGYMIDIGHRTGLFEAAARGPATSAELAERAGLNERYVREWLGAVVTAGIVVYEPGARTYTLPAEHAACLTGSGSMNLAGMSRMTTLLGRHVDGVTEAFRAGGGVPYEKFMPEFTDAADALGRGTYDDFLIASWVPLMGDLPARLADGIVVADIGCGTGHTTNLLARAFPRSRFTGYDINADGIAVARAEAAAWGLGNVRFEEQDVAELKSDRPFDAIVAFDAIHDQADPAGVLDRIAANLADDGTFVMIDINASSNLEENVGNPLAPLLYSVSTLHCMTVSLACDGAGLGTAWGTHTAVTMLGEAGFRGIETHQPEGDPFNLIYVARKAP